MEAPQFHSIPEKIVKSFNNWIMVSVFLFRDINCGTRMIGVMDDYGSLCEIQMGAIVTFLFTDGEVY